MRVGRVRVGAKSAEHTALRLTSKQSTIIIWGPFYTRGKIDSLCAQGYLNSHSPIMIHGNTCMFPNEGSGGNYVMERDI